VAIAPVFIVLVAENKGHIAAISGYMGRDLSPQLGRAYWATPGHFCLRDGRRTADTYAENMGVMAITRVFSHYNFIVAASMAICWDCAQFGAIVQLFPTGAGRHRADPHGLIALMGVSHLIDARVDFSDPKNLFIAEISDCRHRPGD